MISSLVIHCGLIFNSSTEMQLFFVQIDLLFDISLLVCRLLFSTLVLLVLNYLVNISWCKLAVSTEDNVPAASRSVDT